MLMVHEVSLSWRDSEHVVVVHPVIIVVMVVVTIISYVSVVWIHLLSWLVALVLVIDSAESTSLDIVVDSR